MPTQPINPVIFESQVSGNPPHGADCITLRDLFAGLASQGILASEVCMHRIDTHPSYRPPDPDFMVNAVAEIAYHVADAMLAARLKPQSQP